MIAVAAVNSAVPPVAQPFETFVNCSPVRPSLDTNVSAAPAAAEPPTANCMSSQPTPGVGKGPADRDRTLVETRHAIGASELVHPDPDDRDTCHADLPDGLERERDDLGAVRVGRRAARA